MRATRILYSTHLIPIIDLRVVMSVPVPSPLYCVQQVTQKWVMNAEPYIYTMYMYITNLGCVFIFGR